MAEWFKAAVLKTVEGNTSGGSNPSLPATTQLIFLIPLLFKLSPLDSANRRI